MRYLLSSLLLGTALFTTAAQAAPPAYVELQTTMGTIMINLDYVHAPISSNNFIAYINKGFYRNTLFHRVIKNFVIQGGGYDKTSGGFKKPLFAPIVNESNNGLSNLRGSIAMARTTDPNSATSQFFINLVDNAGLDYASASSPGYAVFGKVIKGLDIVDKIGALATYSDLPFTTGSDLIFIERVYTSTALTPSLSATRMNVMGSGVVTSQPTGINCGAGASACTLSSPVGPAKVTLTAKPAAGWVFSGWRGDCRGPFSDLILDTNKGNHNCTALFTKPASSAVAQ